MAEGISTKISRISKHLDIARRNAFADLDNWGFDVLASLRRIGDPYQLSPTQLMQETMVTSGTMTNLVAVLAHARHGGEVLIDALEQSADDKQKRMLLQMLLQRSRL